MRQGIMVPPLRPLTMPQAWNVTAKLCDLRCFLARYSPPPRSSCISCNEQVVPPLPVLTRLTPSNQKRILLLHRKDHG